MDISLKSLYEEFAPIKEKQIDAVLMLLEEGNTIPFIARYRKEMTGSLDELVIQNIKERYEYLEQLNKRKEDILRLIAEKGKLDPELEKEIRAASTLTKLEDLYRPFKEKKRTKAMMAKEKGLEPLAHIIWQQEHYHTDLLEDYINPDFDLLNSDDVLLWVHEILAEWVSDEASLRDYVRQRIKNEGILLSQLKSKENDERQVYEMYYDFKETLKKLQSYRILAINRGEKEGVLRVSIEADDENIIQVLTKRLAKGSSAALTLILKAVQDAYKRFIKPAIERELRQELTAQAQLQAIEVFGENLRHLLLQAPLKGKVIMGFDPAYRTGCKLAVIDEYGKLLAVDVIYPHDPASAAKKEAAKLKFIELIEKYKVDMIAIGNGTASRESERFVAEMIKESSHPLHFVIVNEAGASVYSASENARQEFSDLEVEKRSAISIARRLQDPLAELVKIDPKALGVGQYQHDVNSQRLNDRLKFVVEMVVNQVGVDVNTASKDLLQYVSGLNASVAANVLKKRDELGGFKNRSQLSLVPRLGPKLYEQAVGFLRIPQGENILDNTAIHPERYDLVYRILKDHEMDIHALESQAFKKELTGLNLKTVQESYDVGKETLEDILEGLKAPGRDIRDSMEGPLLRSDVLSIEDLKEGMELSGTVRNVVDFGAFVDIGVKEDGLVHISKLSKNFVKHPSAVVAVGDLVKVWVIGIDRAKGRIQLSMIG